MLTETAEGLYCEAGGFHIDPWGAVPRALITHAHGDHARAGSAAYLCADASAPLLARRFGPGVPIESQPYGRALTIGRTRVSFHPAGHVLGSAQIRVEGPDGVWVVSGDYKRAADPTCAPFEPVRCDVFISEATFALPVFHHPDADGEIAKLLRSVAMFPERAHLVGAYPLGKAQRLIALVRAGGHDAPVYLHGAMEKLTRLYESLGIALGDVRLAREE